MEISLEKLIEALDGQHEKLYEQYANAADNPMQEKYLNLGRSSAVGDLVEILKESTAENLFDNLHKLSLR